MTFDTLLNATLTLKTNTPAQNSQGEPVDSWAGSTTIAARVMPVSGGEEFPVGKKLVKATHKVFCRTTTAITARNRFTWGSRTLEILLVRNIDEAGHHYEIDCYEII